MTLTTINKPYFSPVSVIKSIQRGRSVMNSNQNHVEIPLAIVDMNKTVVHFLGGELSQYSAGVKGVINIALKNQNTLQADSYVGIAGDRDFSWEVIEYV